MITTIAIFAATTTGLLCKPNVMPVYTFPSWTDKITAQESISPAAVPGSVALRNSKARLDAEVGTAMYGLREAVVQRWLWPLINGKYGGAAKCTDWSNLRNDDLAPVSGTAAKADSGYWVPAALSLLGGETTWSTNRIFTGTRITKKVVDPANKITKALVENGDLDFTTFYSHGRRYWLDPTANFLGCIGSSDWQKDGDKQSADCNGGFYRTFYHVKNDIAGQPRTNLFGTYPYFDDLRGSSVQSIIDSKYNSMDSWMEGDNYGFDRVSPKTLSEQLKSQAPGLDGLSAANMAKIAANESDSTRINWNRLALANATVALCTDFLQMDITDGDNYSRDLAEAIDSPGGDQDLVYEDKIDGQLGSSITLALEEEEKTGEDAKIYFVKAKSDNGYEYYTANVDATNGFKTVAESHTNAVQIVESDFTYAAFGSLFYWVAGKDGGSMSYLQSVTEMEFNGNALKIANENDGIGGSWTENAMALSPGYYTSDCLCLYAYNDVTPIGGEDIPANHLVIASSYNMDNPKFSQADDLKPLFELDPNVSKRKISLILRCTAPLEGVVPSRKETEITDDFFASWQENKRRKATGLYPNGCPVPQYVSKAAILNYSAVAVSSARPEDVKADEDHAMKFDGEGKNSWLFTRLVSNPISTFGADTFQDKCEAPYKTWIDDMEEQEQKVYDEVGASDAEVHKLFDYSDVRLVPPETAIDVITQLTETVSRDLSGFRLNVTNLVLHVTDDGKAEWVSSEPDADGNCEPATNVWCKLALVGGSQSKTNTCYRRSLILEYNNTSSLYMKFNFPMMSATE